MREENLFIDYQLLMVKHLQGEASLAEQALLLQWLQETPEHVAAYNQLRAISEACSNLNNPPEFNLEQALANFENTYKLTPFVVKRKYVWKPVLWAVASIAAVFVIAFTLTKYYPNNNAFVLAQAENKASKIILKDGSCVLLSPGASVSSTKTFNSEHRLISLQGEAFFQIKHDKAKPFVIKVNNITITDIGTSFKVKTDSVTKNTTVWVKEGVVQVDYYGQVCVLHAGEYAKTDASSKELLNGKIHPLKPKAIGSDLVFEDMPMHMVVAELNRNYNAKFELASPELNTIKLNATFDKKADIETIKKILSVVLSVSIVEVDGKSLIFTQAD